MLSASFPHRLHLAALAAIGIALAAGSACVDIVGVENLSAAPQPGAGGADGGIDSSIHTGGGAGAAGFAGGAGQPDAAGDGAIQEAAVDVVSEELPDVLGDGADAPAEAADPCPVNRPVQGTACTGAQKCSYDACDLAENTYGLAVCQGTYWAVFAQPCVEYPCGPAPCTYPRELCVYASGVPTACTKNDCISSLGFGASCTCAGDACKLVPNTTCLPAGTASFYVGCTP